MIDARQLLQEMVKKNAADLYLTVGFPASFRTENNMEQIGEILTREVVEQIIEQLLTPQQLAEFATNMEFNSAYMLDDNTRFRINAFRQKQEPALVIRKINSEIPTFEQLGLPVAYRDLVMEKRGLVLIVGPTGSGKSSSLAAMIGYRNHNSIGHIITVEDPIEFMHNHAGCIITQRDVGIDTISFSAALKNALRQRPDVVLIGEIRDREAMEQAINFAETGHLCLATLHANNSYQALERILSFFPEEKHKQLLMNLALNIKGILSQRLLPNKYGGRTVATEILLNQGLIRELIEQGKVKEINAVIKKNSDVGMHSFDQSLLQLYLRGVISEEVALAESDNPANLRLEMKTATANNPLGRVVDKNTIDDENSDTSAASGGIIHRHITI